MTVYLPPAVMPLTSSVGRSHSRCQRRCSRPRRTAPAHADAARGTPPRRSRRRRSLGPPLARDSSAHAVVEAGHRDRAVRAVQAGQDRGQRVHRVGDGAAVAARVQVLGGAGDDDVQADQALGGDRQRRLGRPPHRAVGGDDQVGGELVGVRAHVGRQVRAADLLLALEQELDVQRQRAVAAASSARAISSTSSTGPLSSVTPRPRTTSPSTTSSNGGVVHSARSPVGCTS